MKSDTVVVFIKGFAFVGSAVALQLGTSLGQWANEDVWPSKINWVLIVVLATSAGFNGLMAFMSGTYSSWKDTRANGNNTANTGTKQ